MLVLDAKSTERPTPNRPKSAWWLSQPQYLCHCQSPEGTGSCTGGDLRPTSPQLCPGRLSRVEDETSDIDAGTTFEIPGLDDFQSEFEQLNPDEQQQIREAEEAMAEAEVVVTNHVMGLYELAAIHLSAEQPDLAQAALAIDALACLIDGLGDRLGSEASTMEGALQNIRLAFVQIKGQTSD